MYPPRPTGRDSPSASRCRSRVAGQPEPAAAVEQQPHRLIDEGNDRHLALDLFDAFGSKEKTLHANMGGHTGVPQFEGDDGNRFFARHLK
jgi:hypothetical protein